MLDKEIFEYKNYGSIQINLDKIMQEKNITTYELSNKGNIRFQTIQSLRKGVVARIDLQVLSKICFMLGCNIQDLITYVPPKKSK